MSNIKQIIIVGAGGHAAELDDYLHYANQKATEWKIKGFLDDDASSYAHYSFSAPYLGTIAEHQVDPGSEYLIGIAQISFRRKIVEDLQKKGGIFSSFIHPEAFISRSSEIGQGVVIAPNVNLGPNTKIGAFTVLNSRCSIGHDSSIGAFNFFSPNVCLSGFSEVGNDNLFGINAATIPGIKVGTGNKIMAGMTLDKNVKDQEVVFYRYKEKVIAVNK
ncbi:acetyltransferase [Cyclobacterium sp. SYSU L10401]|uniref:acetyltransferase n=1 Tax=Cyclobacterium sp. SYSU L10401 TaxID=2678657 RepID=UPI0013CFEA7A|nr:acetyltransferase [Cyclobacterium sp. SYSU L10401]